MNILYIAGRKHPEPPASPSPCILYIYHWETEYNATGSVGLMGGSPVHPRKKGQSFCRRDRQTPIKAGRKKLRGGGGGKMSRSPQRLSGFEIGECCRGPPPETRKKNDGRLAGGRRFEISTNVWLRFVPPSHPRSLYTWGTKSAWGFSCRRLQTQLESPDPARTGRRRFHFL